MTAELSRTELDLRTTLFKLCAELAGRDGGPAALDLVGAPAVEPLTTTQVRGAVVAVWAVLCREDRRWSFPDVLSLRCPDGQVLHLRPADLPEFATGRTDAGGDVGWAPAAADRTRMSINPIPDDAFSGRQTPTALLRRGPDDIGTYAVFSTLTAGDVDGRVGELCEQILAGARRLVDVGGGEVVVDAGGPGPLTSDDVYRGYRAALETAETGAARLPEAVTVVLDGTSVRIESPQALRTHPSVDLFIVAPRPQDSIGGVLAELATVLRAHVHEHHGQQGMTLTAEAGAGRDYPVRLVWTRETPPPGFRPAIRLRIRSGDARFCTRDALALAQFVNKRRGWRVSVLAGGEPLVDLPALEDLTRTREAR